MKKTQRRLFGILLAMSVLISCDNVPKTKSGVEINFIEYGEGQVPNHGDIISARQ